MAKDIKNIIFLDSKKNQEKPFLMDIIYRISYYLTVIAHQVIIPPKNKRNISINNKNQQFFLYHKTLADFKFSIEATMVLSSGELIRLQNEISRYIKFC